MVEQSKTSENFHPDLRTRNIKREVLELVPEATARMHNVIPLDVTGNILYLAVANTNDVTALDTISGQTDMYIETVPVSAEKIREAIDFYYQSHKDIENQFAKIKSATPTDSEKAIAMEAPDSPVVRGLSLIINEAVKTGASDIHFQPQEKELLVRFRVDGTLNDVLSLPLETASLLISRIKILANLNIADHIHTQDGQFSVERNGNKERTDIRVAIVPSARGEMAALRLLDTSKVLRTLPELGFPPESLIQYREMLQVPHGMILISGPTGAGKTTTLYASLKSLDYMHKNIITIEDPVEYNFNHITQIRVNVRAGLTFATGLRSILRSDPNVILVGEIRDAETAQIAIQSALTGHLVLSSIHANDAVGVVTRLLDLGIEPFLISSALVGVVSQRMVRKVCTNCAQEVKASLLEQMAYFKETGEKRSGFLCGAGCALCADGYRGRTGIFETLRISDEIRTMIAKQASAPDLQAQAIKEGMIPLIKAGMLKAKENVTTPSEVLRNAYSIC
ncbi:MAG: GspE/PulE family protein [Chloroflexota bacterium]